MGAVPDFYGYKAIDLVIVGAQTSPNVKPQPEWIQSIRDNVPADKIYWKRNIQAYLWAISKSHVVSLRQMLGFQNISVYEMLMTTESVNAVPVGSHFLGGIWLAGTSKNGITPGRGLMIRTARLNVCPVIVFVTASNTNTESISIWNMARGLRINCRRLLGRTE